MVIESIASSFAVNLISSLVYDGLLNQHDKRKVETIRERILNFNRRYDNTTLDTKTFEKFLSISNIDKKVFNYIFNNYKVEHQTKYNFIQEIAQQWYIFINKEYEDNNKSLIYDEFIFLEYFNNLVDEVLLIRQEILNLHEQAVVATLTDELYKGSERIIKEIAFNVGANKTLVNQTQLNEIMISNSRRIYHKEIDESGNIIMSHMIIRKELFADLDIMFVESESFSNRFKLKSDEKIPIVQCLELLDSCRDKFVNRKEQSEYSFEAKGVVITAVGGMGKTVAMIYLWKVILDYYQRSVMYIQLSKVNECSNIDNYIMETITEKLFYNSILSDCPKHKQLELLSEFLATHKESKLRFVLLLDGFNEIHPSKRMSIKNQIENMFDFAGVLVIVTTRPDLSFELPTNVLAYSRLEALEFSKIYSVLNLDSYEKLNSELKRLISNVLMITLYIQICNWAKKEHKWFKFSKEIVSESDLISNFIESLLCKNYYERKQHSDQLVLTFTLKYLIPFIGYKMYSEKVYKIKDRYHLWSIIDEFRFKVFEGQDHFYERQLQYLMLEFLNEWKDMFDNNFSNNLANELINKSLLIQSDEDGGYKFWHQNFRDFMSARYICNEIKRSLLINKVPDEVKIEWDSTLIKYIKEILENEEREINSILNDLLYVISLNSDKNEVAIINVLRVNFIINNTISDLCLCNLNLCNISFCNLWCKNMMFKNCKINWNFFRIDKGGKDTYFVNTHISTKGNILKSSCNRIMYGGDTDHLLVLGADGLVSLNDVWSSKIKCIRFLERQIDCVSNYQISKSGEYAIVSTINEFFLISIDSFEILKIINNGGTYFTYDNRTYTNRITKALFSTDASSILLLNENNKLSTLSITSDYEINSIDYLKINSCVSQDNSHYSYKNGKELCITNSALNLSRIFILDEDHSTVIPEKFCYNNKILALIDYKNNKVALLEIYKNDCLNSFQLINDTGIRLIEFSICGEFVALVHLDNSINIYSKNTSSLIYEIKYEKHDVVGIALSSDAEKVIIFDATNRVTIIRMNTNETIFSSLIQNTFFSNSYFEKCDFNIHDNSSIINHLQLHGAYVKN